MPKKPMLANAKDTVVARLVAYPPKSGEFAYYDEMIKSGVPEKQAVLALISRGLRDLKAKNLEVRLYQHEGVAVETNRKIAAEDMDDLTTIFDPFGILSKRALGQKIGEALFARGY